MYEVAFPKVTLARGFLAANIDKNINPNDLTPPKNETKTFWDSTADDKAAGGATTTYGLRGKGLSFRRIFVGVYSSHAMTVWIYQGIDGTNWRDSHSWPVLATTWCDVNFMPTMPHVKVAIQEAANATATTFEAVVVGDNTTNERGS